MDHYAPISDSPLGPDTEPSTPETAFVRSALLPPRHDGWTPHRQSAFLVALAATHNVALAAREVGMSRQSAYRLRARLKGQPFDHAWEAAFATSYDRLAEAAMDRALNGVEVPHYHKGELVGTHRRFDERLTLGLLALRAGAPRVAQPLPQPACTIVGDFTRMIDRIEDGPESWVEELYDEEMALAYHAARDDGGPDEEDCPVDHGFGGPERAGAVPATQEDRPGAGLGAKNSRQKCHPRSSPGFLNGDNSLGSEKDG